MEGRRHQAPLLLPQLSVAAEQPVADDQFDPAKNWSFPVVGVIVHQHVPDIRRIADEVHGGRAQPQADQPAIVARSANQVAEGVARERWDDTDEGIAARAWDYNLPGGVRRHLQPHWLRGGRAEASVRSTPGPLDALVKGAVKRSAPTRTQKAGIVSPT